MVALQQRVASRSSLAFYEEVTFDSDSGITVGYSLPLSGPSSFALGQSLISVPVFKGDRRPFGKVLGPITAAGKIPLNLEFLTSLRMLIVAFGRAGYSRPIGGTSSVHRVIVPTATNTISGSCQFENAFTETTAVVQRARACRIGGANFNLGTSGPALWDIDVMGIGDIVSGTTQLFTPTDDGLVPTTYFNGQVNYKGVTAVADLNSLSLSLGFNVSRTEVFANGGVAGSTIGGNVEPKGTIKFMMTTTGSNPGSDLTLWNDAIAGTEVLIECFITNQPIGGAAGVFPTKYIRVRMPTCRMGAASAVPGGMAGLFVQQPFEASRSVAQSTAASSMPGEIFGTIGGPYNIAAGNTNFAVKIDGGGSLNVALTNGATRTAQQIVTDLMANGPFAAAATADVFMGNYVRVTSKQVANVGAASSAQFDTGQASNCSATLGFGAVAVAGVSNAEIFMEWWNGTASNL